MSEEDKIAELHDWLFEEQQGNIPPRHIQFDNMAEKYRNGSFLFRALIWAGASSIAVATFWDKISGVVK